MADEGLTLNEMKFVENLMLMRQSISDKMLDTRRDIYKECGYVENITREQYRAMYDREAVAARVVEVLPDECWALDPDIYVNQNKELTTGEKRWKELVEEHELVHYLHRTDIISGIGHFGVLLVGLNDGGNLEDPVPGLPQKSEDLAECQPPAGMKILYVRPFDETLVEIKELETDTKSPRFGRPTMYTLTFGDAKHESTGPGGISGSYSNKVDVHWHRIQHVADNGESSVVYGAPRQRPVFNRLQDLQKILGGSSEMFWKGGFPGYVFEANPEYLAAGGQVDKEALRKEFSAYSNKIERYLALVGVTAKSLDPQVAAPEEHVRMQIMAICIAIGVPVRVFVGSEEAKVSSTQDSITWNKRLQRRQSKYVTPRIVRPFLNRLQMYGILPREDYKVFWPDLNTNTNEEKAKIAELLAKAIGTYATTKSELLMPPEEFLVRIIGLSLEDARAVLKASSSHIEVFPDLEPAPAASEAA